MTALRLLSLVVLLAACDATRDDPFGDLSLGTDGLAYDVGGDVLLTLRNDGAEGAATSGLYCALLEQRTEAGWDVSPEGNARGCGAVEEPVPAGEAIAANVPLDGVEPGTYRFRQVVRVARFDEGRTLQTAPFEVR